MCTAHAPVGPGGRGGGMGCMGGIAMEGNTVWAKAPGAQCVYGLDLFGLWAIMHVRVNCALAG